MITLTPHAELLSDKVTTLLVIDMDYDDYEPGDQDSQSCSYEIPVGTLSEAQALEKAVQSHIDRIEDDEFRDFFSCRIEQVVDPKAETLESLDPLAVLAGMAFHYSDGIGADWFRAFPKPVVRAGFALIGSSYGVDFEEAVGQPEDGDAWSE